MDSAQIDNRQAASPLQALEDDWTDRAGVTLYLKRDDLIGGDVSGNKWRKLRYNLLHARKIGASRLLTFGGAFSNHIRAVAAAGRRFGFETVGLIRGEEHTPLNPVLDFARACCMRLGYLDRETYRRKSDPAVIDQLTQDYGPAFIIPEGGTNERALPGCIEIVREIDTGFDVLASACGTGGTLAGLIAGLDNRGLAIGFSALKGGAFLATDVADLLARAGYGPYSNWRIVTDYHFGGYARKDRMLTGFIYRFHDRHGVELDFVYTGKMMFGLYDLIRQGFFDRGTRIVALHTGGTQTAGLAQLD